MFGDVRAEDTEPAFPSSTLGFLWPLLLGKELLIHAGSQENMTALGLVPANTQARGDRWVLFQMGTFSLGPFFSHIIPFTHPGTMLPFWDLYHLALSGGPGPEVLVQTLLYGK